MQSWPIYEANVRFPALSMPNDYWIETHMLLELRCREPEPLVVQWFERQPGGFST